MKGISPLVATILLIAFSVAVGGIISIWITGFTSSQTTTIGASGERLIKCGDVILDITDVSNTSFTGTASEFNVTVLYKLGEEKIYNFTLYVMGGNNIIGKNVSTDYLKTSSSVNGMVSGELHRFQINTTPTVPASLKSVRVSALCQDNYPVSVEETCCDWTIS